MLLQEVPSRWITQTAPAGLYLVVTDSSRTFTTEDVQWSSLAPIDEGSWE
jgi:hypothetical protein